MTYIESLLLIFLDLVRRVFVPKMTYNVKLLLIYLGVALKKLF